MAKENIPSSSADVRGCDVLVIGGGLAGLLSSLSARNIVEKVIVVDKGFSGKTSEAALSAGQTVVAPPGTDIDSWLSDLVESDNICQQDVFREVLEHSYENVRRLEKLGVKYPKDKKTGDLSLFTSRGTRIVKMTRHLGKALGEFTGGEGVVMAYRNEALKRKVEIINRVYVFTLLTAKDGRVLGAMGFDTRTGELHTFLAKAVVIATGGCSFRGDYAHLWFSTGDGLKLAYEAGAELENMEFNFFNTGSPFFWWEGTGVAINLGARFLNAKKEEFMKKYDPLGNRAEFGVITRAMALESKIGNGPPFYLSLNEIPDPNNEWYGGGYWSRQNMVAWMPIMIDRMKEFFGYDVFKEPVEWMPVFHENAGGVRADINCATSVQGVFAAGRAMSSSHTSVHTGWSFARHTWSGYKAGESAGKFAKASEESLVREEEFKALKQVWLQRNNLREGSLTVDKVYAELRKILFAYDALLLKHASRLEHALGEVRRIANEQLPKAAVPDAHELVKLKELESMLLIAELTLRSSIMRTESRSGHLREDYPYRDNDNWLKWILVSKTRDTGEMSFRIEPLPIGSRYKLVPPLGKEAIPMPREAWDALAKKEPCPVSWTPADFESVIVSQNPAGA